MHNAYGKLHFLLKKLHSIGTSKVCWLVDCVDVDRIINDRLAVILERIDRK